MKTVRKALLATAVAAALSPASVMADTTLFGNFDIAIGLESAAEEAFAVADSPLAADNVIGVEGSIDLENGNAVTYQYVVNVDLDGDTGGNNGFGANYHSYVGYKMDMLEVRVGNQDLPLRLALDKVDNFAGTYADQNNLLISNTTAPSSIMVLGGSDMIKYAVSLDVAQTVTSTGGVTATGENSNDKKAADATRFGAMIDVSINDNISVAAGLETLKYGYDNFGLSANVGLADNAELTLAFEQSTADTNNAPDISTIMLGGSFGLTDTTTLKAQFGTQDLDLAGAKDRNYFAIGADFEMAENVTTYVLAASGTDFGLISTGEVDASGDASVLAGGVKLSF